MSNKANSGKVNCGIRLPEDQYAHVGAPTEWWWHTGTLSGEDNRVFGFEINATGVAKSSLKIPFAFTQIEISDIKNQRGYQKVNATPLPEDWAESNPKNPWYVRLGGSTEKQDDGAVSMQSGAGEIMSMTVAATFKDAFSSVPCRIDLELYQKGEPLLVWGTGCKEVNPQGTTPLTRNNYYYSFTRMDARGVVQIGAEKYPVRGQTWMDHEYGMFPMPTPTEPVIWMLQDMQLSNNVHVSNYTEFGVIPVEGKQIKSYATILGPDGKSTFVDSVTTPLAPTYKSEKGITYFLNFKVDIDVPGVKAWFLVKSLLPDQVFVDPGSADVYEGVAFCKGEFNSIDVSGPAWIEENLG